MKKITLSLFALILGIASYSQNIIHYWSFNSGASSAADSAWYIPASPDSTLATPDTGKITHNVANTEDYGGTNLSAPSGISSGAAFVLRNNANNGKIVTFHVPSKNKKVKEFSFDAKRTSSGFDTLEIAYSIDGTTFKSHTVSELYPTSSWVTYKVALDTITGADSNSNLKIRITIKGASTTSGNTRLDNVALMQKSSTPPPPPKAIPHYGLRLVTTEDASGVADSANVACSVSGVVHGIDMSGLSSSSNTFQLIDATGHITVYKSRGFTPSYTVNESDSVTLYGKVTQYNGLTQFSPDSIKVHGNGVGLVNIKKVSKLDESTESDYIRIDSVSLIDASQWPTIGNQNNVDILTQAGDTLVLRIDRDSYVDDSVAAPAGLFDVIGYGGQFDGSSPYTSGYSILPQLKNHIIMYAAASCNAPSALMTVSKTNVEIELGWTSGGSNTWNVEWGAMGSSMTTVTSFGNPRKFSGLTAATSYVFRVQDSCIGLGVSPWSGWDTIMTDAVAKVIPTYPIASLRTFDPTTGRVDSNKVKCAIEGIVVTDNLSAAGASGPDVAFVLVDETNTTGMTAISFSDTSVIKYTPHYGDSIRIYGAVSQYNGLAQFSIDSVITYKTRVMIPRPFRTDTMGELTESRYIEMMEVFIPDTSQWPTIGSDATVNIVNQNGDTLEMRVDQHTDVAAMWPNAPTGKFRLKGVGGQYDKSSPYLDGYQIFPRFYTDIDTTPKPPCMAPIALKSANVTVSSADISWTSGGGMWNVGWSLNHTSTSADIVDSVMGVTTNPYTVTGLNQNQQYHVYVQEVCRDEHSKWSDPVMFTTLATGINNLDGNKTSLVAFPNPNNIGEVRFNMEISVTVRNILGQTVKSAKEVTSLDISDLDSGVYLIQSEEGDTIRFIVE